MSQLRIDYVEAALIALLQRTMPGAYNGSVQVDSLGDKDFDADGQLILRPPALRVRFAGAKYDALHDLARLTYQAAMPFEILAFESSLRSKADERRQTLVLVSVVQQQLAGARLGLEDGTSTMPITMGEVSLVVTESGPVDQLYSVVVVVEGIAQFDGPNMQPGGGS